MSLRREIVGAAAWTVSAAFVASYTWDSVFQERKDFPFPAFGGSGSGSLLSQIPVIGPTGNWLGTAAANVWDTLFGPSGQPKPEHAPFSQAEGERLVALAKAHHLPAGYESYGLTVIAQRGNARDKQQAITGFTAWAQKNGWSPIDIRAWLKYNGFNV